MPAIIAHHLFGAEVYGELQPVIGANADALDAFLLGNQGPDPLFCLKVLPKHAPYREIGSTMHVEQPTKLLQALHAQCASSDNDAVRAYALGFLCHYLLDSTAHPLVYAQQHALCSEGVTAFDGATVHAAIETQFDERVLHDKLGTTVRGFSPHRETLGCSAEALADVSSALAHVSADAYGLSVPVGAFASSVRLYRAAQLAIDSKREGLRKRIDYARLTGRRYPHVLALTHSASERDAVPFTNDDHIPWPHPFEPGAVVSASFVELYETALERAGELLPRFAHSDFSIDTCAELTPLVNFRGERID